LASPAPKRGIALVARQTTARIDEFMALANLMIDLYLGKKQFKSTSKKK
jgi:hypothetical protein